MSNHYLLEKYSGIQRTRMNTLHRLKLIDLPITMESISKKTPVKVSLIIGYIISIEDDEKPASKETLFGNSLKNVLNA